MSFPSLATGLVERLKEAGAGDPIGIGVISDLQFVRRSGYSLEGVAAGWYSGSGGSYVRLSNGYLELLNPDTGLWHKLYVRGAVGEEQLEIQPGTS